MTVDEAIERLVELKYESKLGGDTCLAICLDESEIELTNVHQITYAPDDDGALILVRGRIGR